MGNAEAVDYARNRREYDEQQNKHAQSRLISRRRNANNPYVLDAWEKKLGLDFEAVKAAEENLRNNNGDIPVDDPMGKFNVYGGSFQLSNDAYNKYRTELNKLPINAR